MDHIEQRDAIVGMKRDMHYVLEALKEIRATMATQKDIELMATKAEVHAISARLESHERDTAREIGDLKGKIAENSPSSLWRKATMLAAGFTAITAAIAIIIKW